MRSHWSVTWSTWRAFFLRESVSRLFGRRAAWVWLLLEPIVHLVFFAFLFAVIKKFLVGGIDTVTWLIFGFLGYFMFQRTYNMGLAAISSASALFSYRQVKPVDAVLVRCASEGMLMLALALLVWAGALFLGYEVWPDQPLQVIGALFLLWLLGAGMALVLSVPRELVPESVQIISMLMTPLYFASGVIIPLSVVSPQIREWLLWNPLVHALSWLRQGFASHYVPFPEPLDPGYAFNWALVLIFLGLAIQRYYQHRVMRL